MIGEIIQNYKIISNLGEGGMSDVYLAQHLRLDKKVAVKMLSFSLKKHRTAFERFEIEAQTLNKLKSKHIVELIDYDQHNGIPYIIMEYVKGNPLDEYIAEISGPIKEEKAVKYMLQILEALQVAHYAGIVHRDLKPSNFMLTEDDNIKILDFGIAKMLSETEDRNLTRMGQGIGTLPYMSPEQILTKELKNTTDIYSLGVCLHQFITGKEPYNAKLTRRELEDKILQEPLQPIKKLYPHASDRMQAIIDKATQKEPEKRFQSCLEFAGALQSDKMPEGVEKRKIVKKAFVPRKSATPGNAEKPEKTKIETEPKKQTIEKPNSNKNYKKILIAGGSLAIFMIIASIVFFMFFNESEKKLTKTELQEGIKLIEEKKFNKAEVFFRAKAEEYPEDSVLKAYLDKIDFYKQAAAYPYVSDIVSEKLILVKNKAGKYGFLNKKAVEVIDCVFDSAGNFSELLPNSALVKNGDKFGFINSAGVISIPVKYNEIADFDENYVWFSRQANTGEIQYGKLDKFGKESPLPCYAEFKNGFAIVKEEGKFTLKNAKCENVLSRNFEDLEWLKEGELLKAKNSSGNYGVITVTGKTKIDFIYSAFSRNTKAHSAKYKWRVKNKAGKLGMLDSDFNESIACEYQEIGYRAFWGKGYFVVKKNGKKGVFDTQKGELVPPIYKQIYWNDDLSWFWVQDFTSKWGALNNFGKQIFACVYDAEPKAVSNNLIVVSKNSVFGAVSTSGATIIAFEYNGIYGPFDYNKKYTFWGKHKSGTTHYFDKNGRKVNQ